MSRLNSKLVDYSGLDTYSNKKRKTHLNFTVIDDENLETDHHNYELAEETNLEISINDNKFKSTQLNKIKMTPNNFKRSNNMIEYAKGYNLNIDNAKLVNYFTQISGAYNKYKGNRLNFMNYGFVLNRICERENISKCVPEMKSDASTFHVEIWKKIEEEIGWNKC